MRSTVKSKLIACPVCDAVNYDTGEALVCRRCRHKVYHEKAKSYARSWAFLITAMILYLPANLYPILITRQLGHSQENTIIGGILSLWEHGSYPIALIILFASVFVPIVKFIMLLYLLIAVKIDTEASKVDKHKLFYITEIIGPWSMVDVFVVAILATLVQYTYVSIIPGVASTAFALMVIFTMLSAHSFDTRMILHSQKEKEKES
ncbi:MAG: paraquat-inducible membrane protein A [Sulfurospirillum sp.]|nr:MAG: paraquat-inducible membrane protein A [Sulfurospirillum sp.]